MPNIFRYNIPSVALTKRLLDYLETNTFYFVLGKNTPWDENFGDDISDTNPPFPTQEGVIDPLLVRLPFKATPAVPSQCGEIEFTSCGDTTVDGQLYSLIDLEKTTTNTIQLLAPRKVYFSLRLSPAEFEFSFNEFRVAALVSNPIIDPSENQNQITYLPSQILDYGIVEHICYFSPLTLSLNKEINYQILLDI